MIQCFVVYHKLCFSHIKWSAIRESLGWGRVGGLVPRDEDSLHCRNCADWAILIGRPCLYSELSEVQEPYVTAAAFAKGGEATAKQTCCFSPVEESESWFCLPNSTALSEPGEMRGEMISKENALDSFGKSHIIYKPHSTHNSSHLVYNVIIIICLEAQNLTFDTDIWAQYMDLIWVQPSLLKAVFTILYCSLLCLQLPFYLTLETLLWKRQLTGRHINPIRATV